MSRYQARAIGRTLLPFYRSGCLCGRLLLPGRLVTSGLRGRRVLADAGEITLNRDTDFLSRSGHPQADHVIYLRKVPRRRLDQGFTSRMTSSSTGEASGRLATPKTRREETASSPKTSRSNSDAASATFGCSVNSGVAATYTPSLTTRLTRFNEPNCFLVRASALSVAV